MNSADARPDLNVPRYPRDMRGHGHESLDPAWPGGANIAVQFVVNYEEGGESCIVHQDAASEAFLSEIVSVQPWGGQRHWNMESIYEYGARVGFWRLRRIFDEFGIPVTVFGVASALARSPEQTAAMIESNWEIASHGLKWIEYKDFEIETERQYMQEAVHLHTEVTGARPLGWYTGRCSMNTLDLVAEEGGFEYASDSYADELPYWVRAGGIDQLIVPYTLDANDMKFATPQGFNSGDQFLSYLKDSFDVLYSEGSQGMPKMLSIGLHCRLAGRAGRAQALRRFIEYAQLHEGVWFARRLDIAKHWARHHPVQSESIRPSAMGREEFVRQFGKVFEHSEWIAERAFLLELGPAHDCAQGIHSALCRVFRSSAREEMMGVLRAHPNLAGKLAQARQLTPDSATEQASAGLDALSNRERESFESLNGRYAKKFGFPFIVAVRDHDKSDILSSFQARLDNSFDEEFAEACRQVERIALHRLNDAFR